MGGLLFDTKAILVGETCGMTTRQIDDFLAKMNGMEINRLKHGLYEKSMMQVL